MPKRLLVLAFCIAVALGLTAAALQRARGGERRSAHVSATASFDAAAAALPASPRPAFRPGRPALLRTNETRARYAAVLRTAVARAEPDLDGRIVTELSRRTTDETDNIVLVLGEQRHAGASWAHVRLSVLPNGRTGWVPRTALGGYHFVHTRLVVDRARLTAVLYYDGREIFRAPVGIGTAAAPTPSGEFYVRDKLTAFANPFYGPVAYGTSARSAVLTDWPDGGVVGIHGTNQPELIPGRVSHGCIRLRNRDILRLSRLMPVGTPLTVR
jgi:lipoprotein-anchoring transpeptidase ErfK/SrfK